MSSSTWRRRKGEIGLAHPPGGIDLCEQSPGALDQRSPGVGIVRQLEPAIGQEGLA
jgi:hypothetical protein